MAAPEPELGKVTTPSKGYADWSVRGWVTCPDCGKTSFGATSLDELVKFTALHVCEAESAAEAGP